MKILLSLALAGGLVLTGCHDMISHHDDGPPTPPTGLRTQTGDNSIEIFWYENRESDVEGYNIYVSSSYSGRYELIGSTRSTHYVDFEAANGHKYYYAVTAYDYEGYESELSRDVAYDIPRPEGYGVTVTDYRTAPATAGYDFSQYAVLPYDDQASDIYFENYGGALYMNVRTDSDIQDMGPTESLLDVNEAPSAGWSTSHDVILQPGHTYVVWTWDDHYAKLRITSLSSGRVVFDWAYQLIKSNPLLKRGPGIAAARPPLVARVPKNM